MSRTLISCLLSALAGWVLAGCAQSQKTSRTPAASESSSGVTPSEDLTAEQIAEQVQRVYETCRSYRDEGVVTTNTYTEEGRYTDKQPFFTAYVRPDRFRYEFRNRFLSEEWERGIIWTDGQSVRTWWSVEDGRSLGQTVPEALANAAGVSSASSVLIPSLLLPDLEPRLLTNTGKLELLGVESLYDNRCYKLLDHLPRGRPLVVYVDTETFLVLRIDTQLDPGRGTHAESTIAYSPQVNVDIGPQALALNLPTEDDIFVGLPPLSSAPPADPTPPPMPDLSAEQILQEMLSRYANCNSYRDRGLVTSVHKGDGRKYTTKIPFVIAFQRPGRFRFECRYCPGGQDRERCIVWTDGQTVRMWKSAWPRGQDRMAEHASIPWERQLGLALAGATGASDGAVYTVPGMLVPTIHEPPDPARYDEVRLLGQEYVGGGWCFQVRHCRRGFQRMLYIDRDTFALRRLENTFQSDKTSFTTAEQHNPELNAVIDPAELDFEPFPMPLDE